MSADVVPIDNTLEVALAYAKAGIRVFPVRWGTKEPATRNGCLDATSDEDQVRAWFGQGRHNVGIATGPQPNGSNLFVVDVDVDKGGAVSFLDLCDRHDGRHDVMHAPQHKTPRGGWHLFFDAPVELRNSRNRLGQGIDTRGAGGYVVAPPSRWANEDGELKPYTVARRGGILERPLVPMPAWLVGELSPKEVAEAPLSASERPWHPAMGQDPTPFDFVREIETWGPVLVRNGWRAVKRSGNETYWARPGKTDRGHSAVLHASGALVIFTQEIPLELEELGQPTVDGTGVTVSIGDFICAHEFGGDRSAFSKAIRERMPRPLAAAAGAGATASPGEASKGTSDGNVAGLNLPAEFWEQREILAQIRQAAHAHGGSPDALLTNVLVRWATMIPPCYKLPDVVGDYATFDLISCSVAETAGGKSLATGVARRYASSPDQALRWNLPVGSGEGIVQAFMVDEIDPDSGKRTGKQVVGYRGIHFIADEGLGMMAQAGRKGSTLLTVLTSSWTGGDLGQANASNETRRIIPAGTVRVAASLSIQTGNVHKLFDEEVVTVGFTGRLLFASAEDPAIPRYPPPRPRALDFPSLPLIPTGVVLTYPDEITQAIRDERWRRATRQEKADLATSHSTLMRAKLAGILALQDGRRDVNMADWDISGQICAQSARLLRTWQAEHARKMADRRVASATTKGELDFVAEDAKEKRLVSALGDRIVQKVLGHTGDPLTQRTLARQLTASSTRHRFEPALDWAVKSGRVVCDGEHVVAP